MAASLFRAGQSLFQIQGYKSTAISQLYVFEQRALDELVTLKLLKCSKGISLIKR